MANSTVEILGGQLDGAVLQNAASEETLKQLVAAISGGGGYSASRGSGGGVGSMLGRTPAGMIAGGVVGAISGAVKGAVNQIGNVVGTAGAFAGMLAKGQGNVSAYTKTLNDQVIKQLPLVGGLLGTVGGAISGSIEEFERWNKTLEGLTSSGATFNNSIIQLMNASTRTYMSLDEFSKIVGSNTMTLRRLGATVTQGAEAFSTYSNAVLKAGGPARNTLIAMGYTVPQINDQLMRFLDVNYRGTRQDQLSEQAVAKSFVEYQTYLHSLTTLTGKRADQLEQEMEVATQDAAYQLRLAELPLHVRENMNRQLAAFVAIHGEGGAELFKARFLGLNPITDRAAHYNMIYPTLLQDIDNAQQDAYDAGNDSAARRRMSEDLMIGLIRNGAEGIRNFRPLIEAGAVGATEMNEIVSASQGMAQTLANMGVDINNMTDREIRDFVRAQLDEQENRETITQILRSFQLAVRDFRVAFVDVLTSEGGPLQMLSTALEAHDLPGKIRQMGTSFGEFVRNKLPDIVRFFAYFADDAGREYFKTQIAYMFDSVGLRLLHYLPAIMGLEVDQDAMETDLSNLRQRYQPILDHLQETANQNLTQRFPGLMGMTTGNPMVAGTGAPPPVTGMGGNVTQAQASLAGIRTQPISGDLLRVLQQAAAASGVNITVASGGQPTFQEAQEMGATWDPDTEAYFLNGRQITTGSARHGGGDAADLDVYLPGGRNPLPLGHPAMMGFVSNLRRYGAQSVGAGHGYMGNRLHVDVFSQAGTGTYGRTWGGDASIADAFLNGAIGPDSRFREGTLGTMGSLLGNFSGGTDAELHNEETVLSPSELTGQMMASAEDSYAGVNELNRNLQALIEISRERVSLSERLAEKMATNSNKLFA